MKIRSKKILVSMRFSLLAIFISLFVIMMTLLISFTYSRFLSMMTYVSIQLMKKSSSSVHNYVTSELQNIETESQLAAQLIKTKVVDPKKPWEMIAYTSSLMKLEGNILPSVQSAYWGDEAGNIIIASKEANGSIFTDMIDHSTNPAVWRSIRRDIQGNILSDTSTPAPHYDPRIRPWYTAAKFSKQTTSTKIYKFSFISKGWLGLTVASPVYGDEGKLSGVFAFNLRLDYLQNLIESIPSSSHGVIFIVTDTGELVAFPKITQVNNNQLINIQSLSFPGVIDSFKQYQLTHQTEFIFKSKGKKYVATYEALPAFGSNHWLIAVIVPEYDYISELQKTSLILLGIGVLILILGLFIISKLVTILVRPLRNLAKETEKIKNFDIEDDKRIHSRIKEITSLSNSIYAMKKGLRSFKKYVPAILVRQLIEAGEDARVGGTKKQLAILFSDINNFSSISEQEDPNQLMEHMCEYLDELTKIIVSTHGTIDKYIGDSIMAFWGAPLPEMDPCVQAAIAALRCMECLKDLNAKWIAQGKPAYLTRIGIHSGEAIVGNLGSAERLSYTAIGDAINIASRLEGVNKIYHTSILVSDSVYYQIKDKFVLRMLDYVTVKGKVAAHYIYELIAVKGEVLPFDVEAYAVVFAKGFEAYQGQRWDEGIAWFVECLGVYPGDWVAGIFIRRCEEFKIMPPEGNWDGVWHINEK